MPNELTPAEQAAVDVLTRQHWTPLAGERVARAVMAAVRPIIVKELTDDLFHCAEILREDNRPGTTPLGVEWSARHILARERAAELEANQ